MEAKIKPQIGDLFIGYDDKVFVWDLKCFNLLYSGVEVDEIIKSPIELSEDWLRRMGLMQSMALTNWWTPCESLNILKIEDGEDAGFWLAIHIGDGEFETIYKIDFVHQLQNQYYLISYGSELTITDINSIEVK